MIQSVFQNEQELLRSIIEIHCPNGIELDPMYFKGNFYKEIPEPKYKFDIMPQFGDVMGADAKVRYSKKTEQLNLANKRE